MIAEFPDKLQFLFESHRYKVLYGGRGGTKSWGIARALLIQGTQRSLRVLCARETQQSIAESVHKLLCDQIEALGLADVYRIEKSNIYGPRETQFIFCGLKQDVSKIKSYEGCDIAWVEEAQSVSHHSWDVLIPTIRKDGSEIWLSFNPDLETDATYQRFVVNPPPDAKVVKVGWQDNPWFPDVLRREMEHCRATDPDKYLHIWEGCCISVLEGAIYATEIRLADQQQRIARVPYDPARPVYTFWDLGWGDNTSIWFAQSFPMEFRLIDFEEGSQRPLHDYIKMLQARPYVYETHWLPWDAEPKSLGTGKSVVDLMRAAGLNVQIVPKLSVSDGINACRTIFPQCWFDREKCADGLQHLRHYRYGTVKSLDAPSREPLHDIHSHAADAFRSFGVAIKHPKKAPAPRVDRPAYRGSGGWMA